MILNHLLAMSVAYFVDWLIGDPKNWPHPVKGFGWLIARLEQKLNQGRYLKLKGFVMTLIVVALTGGLTLSLVWLSYQIGAVVGIVFEGLLIATTLSAKGLKQAAQQVYDPLVKNDLTEARRQLDYIVGRDTEHLGESEIVRGTVETVAENTSDGVTAPLFWALIGGAPFALVYRAVNTCDSMVGYQNERYLAFGYASAKLDDGLNWIPARLTGIVLLFVKRPTVLKRRSALRLLREQAHHHNSPNSGWGEAAVALVLGVQLGGTNTYQGVVSASPFIGFANRTRSREHIKQAIVMMERAVFSFLLCLWLGGVVIDWTFAWIESI